MELIGNDVPRATTVRHLPSADEQGTKPWAAWIPIAQQRSPVVVWATAILVAVLTFGLRAINLDRSFDISYDEVVYTHVSQSVVHTLHIYFEGQPLYIHPPLFYFLEGSYLSLFFPHGDPIQVVFDARYLNAILAGLSASMLFLIGRRLAGWLAGAIAAVIFALDPFVIKISSRNLLEPSALLWILVGYAILLTAPYRRIPAWRIYGAGCAFGAALLTKEETAFHTLLPLAVCFLFNWSIPRRVAVMVGATTCLVYATYPLAMAATGQWKRLAQEKLTGINRLVGTVQISGYNQTAGHTQIGGNSYHQAPSFTQAILNNLGQFATTYALLGLGLLAIGVLLLRKEPTTRLVAIWVMCAYALQAYSIKLGTNEEQYYYYLVAPAILAAVTAGVLVLRSRLLTARARSWAIGVGALLFVTFVGWSGYNWLERHSTPDTGYQHLFAYLERHVPQGSTLAATNLTADALLHDFNYRFGYWGTVPELKSNHVQYVIVSTLLIKEGYDAATPELYDWLVHNATRIYSFNDPTYGLLALYHLRGTG